MGLDYDRWLGICHRRSFPPTNKWFFQETKLILRFYQKLGNPDRLARFKAGYREEREWENRKKGSGNVR